MDDCTITLPPHGYVKWLSVSGDQFRILGSARLSTGGEAAKGDDQDRGLLRYLYKNEHLSPFEKVQVDFQLKVPHSIAKQVLRHRTAKFNEYSLRYSEAVEEMYLPPVWRVQGEKNHQGSGEPASPLIQRFANHVAQNIFRTSLKAYKYLIAKGIAREQARFLLPLANYTMIDVTMDLRNFLHFLELRLHSHAQEEIRTMATALHTLAWRQEELQWVLEIFDEFNELKYLYHEAINKSSNTTELKKRLQQFIKE